jgi:hypothetical protein
VKACNANKSRVRGIGVLLCQCGTAGGEPLAPDDGARRDPTFKMLNNGLINAE